MSIQHDSPSSPTARLLLWIRENAEVRQGGHRNPLEARSRNIFSFGHHPITERAIRRF
jgi:hypothetical protein